jgi:hypothetical protein
MLTAALIFAVVAGIHAQDKDKEVTKKGTILCTKCELKETKACGNAIRVKEDGKDVIYYFLDNGAKEKYHKDICTGPKEGTVVGVVSEKDKKKMIKPSKVEFK